MTLPYRWQYLFQLNMLAVPQAAFIFQNDLKEHGDCISENTIIVFSLLFQQDNVQLNLRIAATGN